MLHQVMDRVDIRKCGLSLGQPIVSNKHGGASAPRTRLCSSWNLPSGSSVTPHNRAPGHEALAVSGERSRQRLAAVGPHQHLVGLEDVQDLRPVDLDLVEGLPHIGVQIGRVLQLDQHQRQTVDEQDDVSWSSVMGSLPAVRHRQRS
jgi:hypothetical protein